MIRNSLARIAVGLFALAAGSAFAATLVVTNLNDSGAGSLRDRLAAAGPADTIVFNAGLSGTIPLAAELVVAQNVTITGPGPGTIAVSGQGAVRVFNIGAFTVTLSGITIADGLAPGGTGGGIATAGGTVLTVGNVVFDGNTAGNGGAIDSFTGSTVTVDQSTFTGNVASAVGGGAIIVRGTTTVTRSSFLGNTGAINGGAINVQPAATLTLVNTTFSGNSTPGIGGALTNLGTLVISSSTFSANVASNAGAIGAGAPAYTVNNSVFVDNQGTAVAPGAGTFAPAPAPATASNNVFFNNTATGVPDDATGYGTANAVVATSAPLAPLANNGGPTLTMLPIAGRAAVCAGDPALLPPGTTTDQRLQPRLRIVGGTPCLDAGAAEIAALAAASVNVPTLSWPALLLLALMMAGASLAMRSRFTR